MRNPYDENNGSAARNLYQHVGRCDDGIVEEKDEEDNVD